MSLLFSNARSVLNKRAALSAHIDSCSADIVILSETWLSAKVQSSEIFDCEKKYALYRYDRDVRVGGGVLIAVNEEFPSSSVPVVSALEVVCVRITIDNRDCIFCACYRPPTAPRSFCDELHDVLNNIVMRYPT